METIPGSARCLKEADKLIGKLNVIAAYEFEQEHYEKIANELLKLYELFGFEIQSSVIERSSNILCA